MSQIMQDSDQVVQADKWMWRAFGLASSWIGSIVLLVLATQLARSLVRCFKLYIWSQKRGAQRDFKNRYGQWAVVTGATDGIGLSIARELAKRGMSILAVSRNATKLATTKAELEKIPEVGEVEMVQIDLANPSMENFERIRRQINPGKRLIGVLVNNAGTYPDEYKRLNEFQIEELLHIANLNMLNPVHMTRMIMPGMLQRGKGLVINVSSLLGSVTSPHMSIYGPSKSFLDAFTRQLQVEYASSPIEVVLMKPGGVFTAHFDSLTRVKQPSLLEPSPQEFAQTAINALSADCNSYTGTLAHELLLALSKLLEATGLFGLIFPIYIKLMAKQTKY